MTNFIIAAVVLILVGAAVLYIRKEKKHGAVCIGCPSSCSCGKKQGGGCGCHDKE